jgi:sugar lactone lactonase YvrE
MNELYVSDSGHHQVLKINPTTGLIVVVAGNGTACYNGDGLPAYSAGLNNPGGLAFDNTGNLFIADRNNFVVRRVDALTGIITTVAGTGLFTGQVVDPNPAAPLGDGGPATAATFGAMGDLTVDSAGNVIVCDQGNDCIRRFTVGGNIATIAGVPGSAGFSGDGVAGGALAAQFRNPSGVVVDAAGNIFIADNTNNNQRVRRLDGTNTVTTVAGGGNLANGDADGALATDANLGSLGGLAFESSGTLLVACIGQDRVRRIDVASAAPITITVAGGGTTIIGDLGPATGATLNNPRDVAVDQQGNIYVYDASNGRIRRMDKTTGFIDTVIGTGLLGFVGDRGPHQFGILVNPQGAAYDAAGNLYVADTGDHAVRKVAPDGTITTFAGNGTPAGLGDSGPAYLASLDTPRDVAVFGNTLYIADFGNDRIRAVDLTTGIISTYVQLTNVVAMIVDPAGQLYVARNNRVDIVATDKTVTTYVGSAPQDTLANPLGDGLPPANATLNNPSGLALGPGGALYIADTGNDRVRLISAPPASVTSTVAGGGTATPPAVGDGGAATAAVLDGPTGVTLDTAGTRLIISDTNHHRVRAVDIASGVISTIAGTGAAGFSGDGDVAASAQVNVPGHIFARNSGIVFADVGNNRIRSIVTATDIDPKLLAFAAKLSFTTDKKTGQMVMGKDSVALKAGLPLPAGIAAANLKIAVDVVDLHQRVQLDAKGKQPKATKAAKAAKIVPVFDFTLPKGAPQPVSKFALSLKGTSVAGAKPTGFSFASKGTFREQLGRAGFSNATTPKEGVLIPVRVNITLDIYTFTGLTTVQWKATEAKGGAAKSVKQ